MPQTENPYVTTTKNNLVVTSYIDEIDYIQYAIFTLIPGIDTTEFGTPENPHYCYADYDIYNNHSNIGLPEDVYVKGNPDEWNHGGYREEGYQLNYFDVSNLGKWCATEVYWNGSTETPEYGVPMEEDVKIINVNNKSHYAYYDFTPGYYCTFKEDHGLFNDFKNAAETQTPITLAIIYPIEKENDPETPEDPNNEALIEFVSSLSEAPDEFTIDISQIKNMNYTTIEENGFYYNDYLAIPANIALDNDLFLFGFCINKNISNKIKFYVETDKDVLLTADNLIMLIADITDDFISDGNNDNSAFIQLNNTLNSNLLQFVMIGTISEGIPSKLIFGFV